MSIVFPASGLAFLRDLEQNNDKDWFQANKKRYERELKAPSRALASAINDALRDIAPEYVAEKPEKQVSRINRDIRFSKDKTPYNTHVWMHFSAAGHPRGSAPGLYLGLSNESWGVGAGVWKPEKDAMDRLRAHIAENHAQLRAIVEAPSFASTFGAFQGEAYKRVPSPYPADHPAAEWLKFKGMHVRYEGPVEDIPTARFVPNAVARLEQLVPLVRFIADGLAG